MSADIRGGPREVWIDAIEDLTADEVIEMCLAKLNLVDDQSEPWRLEVDWSDKGGRTRRHRIENDELISVLRTRYEGYSLTWSLRK